MRVEPPNAFHHALLINYDFWSTKIIKIKDRRLSNRCSCRQNGIRIIRYVYLWLHRLEKRPFFWTETSLIRSGCRLWHALFSPRPLSALSGANSRCPLLFCLVSRVSLLSVDAPWNSVLFVLQNFLWRYWPFSSHFGGSSKPFPGHF